MMKPALKLLVLAALANHFLSIRMDYPMQVMLDMKMMALYAEVEQIEEMQRPQL